MERVLGADTKLWESPFPLQERSEPGRAGWRSGSNALVGFWKRVRPGKVRFFIKQNTVKLVVTVPTQSSERDRAGADRPAF